MCSYDTVMFDVIAKRGQSYEERMGAVLSRLTNIEPRLESIEPKLVSVEQQLDDQLYMKRRLTYTIIFAVVSALVSNITTVYTFLTSVIP